MFENPPVDISAPAVDTPGRPARPQLRDEDFQPLEPKLVTLRTVFAFIPWAVMLIGGLILVVALADYRWIGGLVALAAILIFIANVVAIRLSYKFWGYAVRQHDLTVRKGVVLRSVISVPFNRVQHAAVQSGPFERSLGLSTIKVFTAGGAGADLSIEGLSTENAERLKDHILQSVSNLRQASS